MHFSVDWVPLRDAARTLIKTVILLRKHGLLHRIEPPEDFLRKINRLRIEMTHTRKSPTRPEQVNVPYSAKN